MVRARLACLPDWLDGRDYLEDHFTAGDLVREIPELEAYRLRCEARPAFRKALADQMAAFAENAPPD
jgi:glutathione S-transferase